MYRVFAPPRQIGQVAAAAKVKRLVLSHLTPDIEQAKSQVVKSIRTSYAGEILFATDLMRFDIDKPAVTTG